MDSDARIASTFYLMGKACGGTYTSFWGNNKNRNFTIGEFGGAK